MENWKKEHWRDELRNITNPSSTYFISEFNQNEIVAIERFIQNLLNKQKKEIKQALYNRFEKDGFQSVSLIANDVIDKLK